MYTAVPWYLRKIENTHRTLVWYHGRDYGFQFDTMDGIVNFWEAAKENSVEENDLNGVEDFVHNRACLRGAMLIALRCSKFPYVDSFLQRSDRLLLVDRVTISLLQWAEVGSFPLQSLWICDFGFEQLLELKDIEKHSSTITFYIDQVLLVLRLNLEIRACQSVLSDLMGQLMQRIGPRIILALLGIRTTFGFIADMVPPSSTELLAAFEKKHMAAGSKLSVGARALAKHCHRGKEGWWGVCTGNEATKNSAAHALCTRLLNSAVWVNLHQIVHGTRLVEVRVKEGYGARWALDIALPGSEKSSAIEFRGFLEPHVDGGHEKGWRH